MLLEDEMLIFLLCYSMNNTYNIERYFYFFQDERK